MLLVIDGLTLLRAELGGSFTVTDDQQSQQKHP